MKYVIIVVLCFTMVVGAICLDFTTPKPTATRTYDSGYEEGFDSGYDIGYEDGFDARSGDDWGNNQSILYAMEEAIYYARDNSGWHPEEAVDLIEAYQKQLPYYENGSPPTHQDYLAAVQSLQDFFEYFYSGKYK